MRSTILKISLLAMLALLLQQSVLAQGPGRGRLSPSERAAELKKELNLSDEQTAKIQTIYEQQEKEMRALFETSGGDRAAMREAMQQKVKETDEKILSLLNAEQQKKYKSFVEERRARLERRD